jgi:hypothetical protein
LPVHFTDPLTGVTREEQAEVIQDAFVKARAQFGSGARTFPTMIEVDRDTEEQSEFRPTEA